MNKRQKGQVILATLFAVLFIVWLFMPGEEGDKIFRWCQILGLISSAGGVLSMVMSYRAEEKSKKKSRYLLTNG